MASPDVDGAHTAWDRYWWYIDRDEIRLPVCTGCGQVDWYPHVRCVGCGSTDRTWVALSGAVDVFLRMTVHRDFLGHGAPVPYDVALVTPDEFPSARLVVAVDPDRDGAVRTGDRGRLIVAPHRGRRVATVTGLDRPEGA
jgi:uncharacterized OB-fold protein